MANPKKVSKKKKKEKSSSSKASTLEKRKERDQLVAQYLPFATYIVKKVSKTVSANVDFEDLLAYAKVGLIEAAERFDSRFKVDFRTFAFYRIRGAIYDGLRTTGWLSRSQFAKHQFEEASNNYMRCMSDRVAAGGGKNYTNAAHEISDTILNLASVYIMSLDAAEGLQVKDTKAVGADEKFELEKTRSRVRDSIEKLPEKERQLIKLYYYGGMTLDEAGNSLGLSRSWTSRLHARALDLLQKIIKEANGELPKEEVKEKTKSKTKTKKSESSSKKRNRVLAKSGRSQDGIMPTSTRC